MTPFEVSKPLLSVCNENNIGLAKVVNAEIKFTLKFAIFANDKNVLYLPQFPHTAWQQPGVQFSFSAQIEWRRLWNKFPTKSHWRWSPLQRQKQSLKGGTLKNFRTLHKLSDHKLIHGKLTTGRSSHDPIRNCHESRQSSPNRAGKRQWR